MARVNKKTSRIARRVKRKDATINKEGGIAFNMSPKLSLYTQVATCLVGEPKFYEDKEDQLERILDLIPTVAKKDPKFILSLANYARNVLNLRTIPCILLAEAARLPECKNYIKEYATKILKRPDQLTETLAYYISLHERPIIKCLRKGLNEAVKRFDEYGLEKYFGNDTADVKFRDLLRICHPKPATPYQSVLWKYFIKKDLDGLTSEEQALVPRIVNKSKLMQKKELDKEAKDIIKKYNINWEVLISKFGSTKETWELAALNMGYMAKLRNLRNLLETKALTDEDIDMIKNPEEVKKSKQFPYRFYSAYKMLQSADIASTKTDKLLDAIEEALEISVANVEGFSGSSCIMIDLSGSMDSCVSERSIISNKNIASLLGAIAKKKSNDSIVIGFGDSAKIINLSNKSSMLENMEKVQRTDVGCSTDAWKAFKILNDEKIKVDRIVLFSDMQCYDSNFRGGWGFGSSNSEESVIKQFDKYKSNVNPKAFMYSVDLAGCATLQIPEDENNACVIGGWSEQILNFITAFEEDKDAVMKEIEKY